MQVFTETERLLLRELGEEDAPGILAMEDATVRRYLPGALLSTIEEAKEMIGYIRKQYIDNGIGRWAMVRKEDGAFIGWCGIKLVNEKPTNGKINYYDIGYRLLPAYWNKGYALEAARAVKRYAFDVLQIDALHATIMQGNTASERIAERLGMHCVTHFEEEGQHWNWYTVEKHEDAS